VKNQSHLKLVELKLSPSSELEVKGDVWVFSHILKGEGCVLGSTAPILLGEGMVMVKPPAVSYQLRASQIGELHIQYFQIQPELLSGVLTSFERMQLQPATRNLGFAFRAYATDHHFGQRFARITDKASQKSDIISRCEMLQLAALVFDEYLPRGSAAAQFGNTALERFEKLFRETSEAEILQKPVEELARQCCCSIRHFSRMFRDHFGESFVPKRTELYLQKARDLLAETDAKIIDVALESGFQHVGRFTALFKERFGLTPSAWRKSQTRIQRPKSVRRKLHVKLLV
jgi:AraC-like DNA-binding protein